MPNLEVKVGKRALLFSVDDSEIEAASLAARVLQETIDEINSDKEFTGSTTSELLIAGISIAGRVVELNGLLKDKENQIQKLMKKNNQSSKGDEKSVENQKLLNSLEKLADQATTLANQLENSALEEVEGKNTHAL